MDDLVRRDLRYDFYGGLLTERQRRYWNLYYGEDLSLGEIARQERVSRQAVQYALKRAEDALVTFEDRLHLVEEFLARREKLRQVYELLGDLPRGGGVDEARSLIAALVDS